MSPLSFDALYSDDVTLLEVHFAQKIEQVIHQLESWWFSSWLWPVEEKLDRQTPACRSGDSNKLSSA